MIQSFHRRLAILDFGLMTSITVAWSQMTHLRSGGEVMPEETGSCLFQGLGRGTP